MKIDRIFVSSESRDSTGKQLMKSILDIANNLNLETVASGLEHQHQIDFVRRNSCDYVQGYYYSKPVPGDEVVQFLNFGVLKDDTLD